jgi:REP element-mobilizing transposase RayT
MPATLSAVARKARITFPNLTYHVWANATAGSLLFRDDDDKNVAIELLREEVALSGWSCLAYVLMTTHYHVLLQPVNPTLSSGFGRLNLRYAQYFNKHYDLGGHVFARRFDSKVVEGEAGQLEVMRYIARNPTKARMCDKPEDYAWSSFGSMLGVFPPDGIADIEAALAPLNGSPEALRTYVAEDDPRVRRGQVLACPPALSAEQPDHLIVERAVRREIRPAVD